MTSPSSAALRSAAWALRNTLRWSRLRAGVVLVYHGLAAEAGNSERELVPAHSTDVFEGQLRHLEECYRIVPLDEILAVVIARRRGERFPVALTFDDDLRSHVELATPALIRHGAPATFFLGGTSLERPHLTWWHRLEQAHVAGVPLPVEGGDIHEIAARVEAMSATERADFEAQLAARGITDPSEPGLRSQHVRDLAARGFRVGFHTLAHLRLTDLDDSALRTAFIEGRKELEAAAGQKLNATAYPHGKADERVARAAREAGFVIGATGRYEAVVPKSEPLLVGRFEPTRRSVAHFAAQVARALLRRPHA